MSRIGPIDFAALHPGIKGLIRELPLPGEVWPLDEREEWFAVASAFFDLLYQPEPTGVGHQQEQLS